MLASEHPIPLAVPPFPQHTALVRLFTIIIRQSDLLEFRLQQSAIVELGIAFLSLHGSSAA